MKATLLKRMLSLGLLAGACLPQTVTCRPGGSAVIYGPSDYYYEETWAETTYYEDGYYTQDCCGDGFGFDFWYDQWP
jgi:hypothetical protein